MPALQPSGSMKIFVRLVLGFLGKLLAEHEERTIFKRDFWRRSEQHFKSKIHGMRFS